MAKKKVKDLGDIERIKTLDMLYTAASAVKGRDAVKRFLRDLLTPSERIMLGRRIWIARMLLMRLDDAEIARRLGVGRTTVYRVSRWLEDQYPGYEDAIKGLEREMDTRSVQREASADPFSYAALKRRYKLHFLLFPDPKPKKQYRDEL